MVERWVEERQMLSQKLELAIALAISSIIIGMASGIGGWWAAISATVFCVTMALIVSFFVTGPKRELRSLKNRIQITNELLENLIFVEDILNSEEEQTSNLRLKKAERLLKELHGVSLIEPRRATAKYEGGHAGVSVRIAKGVYWRVGKSKARRVPQGDILKIIDRGVLHITNQRAVFTGSMLNREWRWDKLQNHFHDYENFHSIIHVSSRQKGSGFIHTDDEREAAIICFAIDVGIASFYGEIPELSGKLHSEKDSIKSEIKILEHKGVK
jgi:hypothetical protein